MAIAPQNNEAFLREVDEELRRDQLAGFWTRYGRWLLVAVLAGLVALAGWLYWQHRQAEQADASGEELSLALRELGEGKTEGLKARIDALAKSSNEGIRASALLTSAGMLAEAKDLKGAAAAYKKVADDTTLAQPYRDIALLRQTAIEFDTLKPAEVVARLKPLAVDGGPWFGSAGEMVAISYMRMAKPDLAAPLFAKIAENEKLPETIRSRARQMAGVLGVDAVDQTNASDPANAVDESNADGQSNATGQTNESAPK